MKTPKHHPQSPLVGLLLLLGTLYLQLALWCQLLPHGMQVGVLSGLIIMSFIGLALVSGVAPGHLVRYLPLLPSGMPATSPYQQRLLTLCSRARLPVPQLQFTATAGSLAYAIGSTPQRSMIALEESFLNALSVDEVDAILAHELGHISLGHSAQLTLLHGAVLPLMLPLAGLFAVVSGGLRRRFAVPVLRGALLLLPYVFLPLTSLLVLFCMRRWEYAADRFAVELVGKSAVLATLRSLHGVFMPEASWSQLTAFNERGLHRLFKQFSTHPSIPQRITALWR